MKDLTKKYNDWALVTGASSGIGEIFARRLAAEGFNLILTARRKHRLDKLGSELEKEHGITVKTVEADLSEPESIKIISNATVDIKVGLLVNNAGAESHGSFLKNDIHEAAKLVQLNVTAPMQLAHLFGNKMAERGRGGIIFVSSVLGHQAVPYFANYSATKTYILSLGEALNYELKKKGVDVTVISPGLTDTKMKERIEKGGVDFSKTPIKTMPIKPVVEKSIKSLGRKSSVIPGGMNNALAFMGKHIMTRQGMTSMFGNLLSKAVTKDQL